MGNSEVGHLNIGAGRIVAQDLVRVGDAVADGTLAPQSRAAGGVRRPRAAGRGVLHVAGLVSDGGVHSHVDHLRAIVGAALAAGVPRVAVHAFTDGRDVSPHQAAGLLAQLERGVGGHGRGRSRPSSGATTAMDRDHRIERTELARAAIVDGVGERAAVGARPPSRPATPRASPTSSSSRSCSATPGCASRRAIRSCSSTSAPTARARSAARCCRRSGCS